MNKDRLVDDWRNAWRWWTVRLHVAGTALLGFVLAYPEALSGGLRQLPAEVQTLVPAFVPVAWFVLVMAARLHRQAPKDAGK